MITTLQYRMEVRSVLVLTSVLCLMVMAFIVAYILLSIIPGYYLGQGDLSINGHISMMGQRLQNSLEDTSSHPSIRIGRNLINSSYLTQ